MDFEIVLTIDESGTIQESNYFQAKKEFFQQIAARHQSKLAYKAWLQN
jgi:hypothetical protein